MYSTPEKFACQIKEASVISAQKSAIPLKISSENFEVIDLTVCDVLLIDIVIPEVLYIIWPVYCEINLLKKKSSVKILPESFLQVPVYGSTESATEIGKPFGN